MNDLPKPMTDRPRPGPNWGGSAARTRSLVADLGRGAPTDVNGRHKLGRLPGPGMVRPLNAGGKATGERSPVADLTYNMGLTQCSTARCLVIDAIRGMAHYHVKMGAKHKRQPLGCRGLSDRRGRLRTRPGACLSPQPNKLENPRGSSPVPHPGACGAGRSGGVDIAPWWRVAETPPLIGPVPEARGDDRGVGAGRESDPGAVPGRSTISLEKVT